MAGKEKKDGTDPWKVTAEPRDHTGDWAAGRCQGRLQGGRNKSSQDRSMGDGVEPEDDLGSGPQAGTLMEKLGVPSMFLPCVSPLLLWSSNV